MIPPGYDLLIVDGYNLIHNWPKLAKLAKDSLDTARTTLINTLSNYQGYRGIKIILVFDAHKSKNQAQSQAQAQSQSASAKHKENITCIYTSFEQTADAYIESIIKDLAAAKKPYKVAVATNDSLEQTIIMAKGAIRLSCKDFLQELRNTEDAIKKTLQNTRPIKNNQLLENLDPQTALWLDNARHKKKL